MNKTISAFRISVYKLIALFCFGLLVLPTSFVTAAASFNNDAQDYPTVLVSNATKNPGCTTCWGSSVSADAGDVVSFLIYYHNTGNETANQTRLQLTLPSGTFTSNSVQGKVWANNSASVTGSATVNISSNQSLSFIPGSLRWYPNQTSTNPQNPPMGQNGSEVVSSAGLNVGDIAQGWPSQGHVIFRTQVGSGQGQQGSLPTVSTNSATNFSQNSVTLNGTINPNGTQTSAWFEYGVSQSLGQSVGFQAVGSGVGSTNISATVSGLLPNTTYYYRVVAQNQSGSVQGNIQSFVTSNQFGQGFAPAVNTFSAISVGSSFATLQGSVNPNSLQTSAWFEYGVTQSLGQVVGVQTIGSGNSYVNYSFATANLQPSTSYYYRAVAQNVQGTAYGNILTFTTPSGNGQTGNAPIVTTVQPTVVQPNVAVLTSRVNPNGLFTTTWFEYGFTQNLGQTTQLQSIGSNNVTSDVLQVLSGLTSNRIYYFRAVAQNPQGTIYGNILSFTTPINTTPTTPVIPGTPTTSNGVTLETKINIQNPEPGNEIEYAVTYKNGGSASIRDAVVKVILPAEVEFVSANQWLTSQTANNLVFTIGTVGARSEGTIIIKGRVDRGAKDRAVLIFASTLEYTNGGGAFRTTSSYLTVTVKGSDSPFGAFIGQFGGFFGPFLLILLLILIALYVMYRYLVAKPGPQMPTR